MVPNLQCFPSIKNKSTLSVQEQGPQLQYSTIQYSTVQYSTTQFKI